MASTAADLSTPTARAKSVVGSTIIAETIAPPEKRLEEKIPPPRPPDTKPPETMGTPTARVPEGAPVPAGTEKITGVAPPSVEPKAVAPPTPIAASAAAPGEKTAACDGRATDRKTTSGRGACESYRRHRRRFESALLDFLDRQIIPYLTARRGDRMRLGKPRFSEDTFRLRQTPRYRSLSRSRRRNAGLVRRTADARSPNQIASLAARLAVRPRADLVSAADARFLARICDVVQVTEPMPKPGRTQKQIAERYKGNLGYYRRLHPWRRTRLIVSLFTIFGGLVAIGLFQKQGRETFFNAGKISTSHAKFADDCAQCHDRDAVTGNLPRCYAIVFVTASPSKRSIANARLVMRSTAFTKRTSFKTAPARRVTRNIAGLLILDWSRARNARPATTTPP